MARGKALTEEEIETYYRLILEYGQDKGGMSYVNKKLQEMLYPEKTIEEISERFRCANPNSRKCTPKRKAKFYKMKALKSGQIALFESQRNARRTADLEEHLESLDLSRLQNIKDSADKLKEYQIIFAIHKTISANVREKIEINALIDLINANEDME